MASGRAKRAGIDESRSVVGVRAGERGRSRAAGNDRSAANAELHVLKNQ